MTVAFLPLKIYDDNNLEFFKVFVFFVIFFLYACQYFVFVSLLEIFLCVSLLFFFCATGRN